MRLELPPVSSLEKENLEVHVDLSTMRFRTLESRLDVIEQKVTDIHEEISNGNKSLIKVIIGTTGTIIVGLLSTLITIITKMGGIP